MINRVAVAGACGFACLGLAHGASIQKAAANLAAQSKIGLEVDLEKKVETVSLLQTDMFDKMKSFDSAHEMSRREKAFNAEQVMHNDEYRLPRTIFPIHYDLSFKILSEDAPDFLGQSQIKAEVRVNHLTEIVMHGRGLSMTHLAIEPHLDNLASSHLVANNCCASFTFGTNRCVIDEGFDVGENNDAEFLLIKLPDHCYLPKGRVDIIMRWTGRIHDADDPIGWHKQPVKTENIPRYITSTAFQPMDARQAFPCFDEPNMKATFTLTVDAPRLPNINTGSYVPLPNIILSNMPASTEQVYKDGWRVTSTFQTTPKMSTFQLNWVIGPFKAIQLKQHGPPIRVWATVEDVPFAQFALNAAGQLLPAMGTYFSFEYSDMMPKLDLVALPFLLSLAEQNWGLLSFKSSSLLVKPSSTATQRQNVVQIVSHEICHQWFGNLVTVDWWDSIWVQEGAASWCARILTQKIYPEYGAWAGSFRMWELRQDAVESSVPLISQVNTPSDIANVFQKGFIYHKGNFLMTMIRHVVGDTDFAEGLRNFLRSHAFGVINAGSFINTLTHVAEHTPKMRLAQIVSDFGFKRGYPLVVATEEENQAHGTNYNNVMEVRQEWFWPPSPPTHDRSKWDMSNHGGTCNPSKRQHCPGQGPSGKYQGPLCSTIYNSMQPPTQPWGHDSGDITLSTDNPVCTSSKCTCPAANVWTIPLFVSYGQNKHFRDEMQVSISEGNYLLLKDEGEIPLKIPRSHSTVIPSVIHDDSEENTNEGQWRNFGNINLAAEPHVHHHHHHHHSQKQALRGSLVELETGYKTGVGSADRQWRNYERTFTDMGQGTFNELGSLRPAQHREQRIATTHPGSGVERISDYEMIDNGGGGWGNSTYNDGVATTDEGDANDANAHPIIFEEPESGSSTIQDIGVRNDAWAGNIANSYTGGVHWDWTQGDYAGEATGRLPENTGLDYRPRDEYTPQQSWNNIPEVTDYWFKMNAGAHVPMRVLYTPNNWNKLINMVDYSSGCDATRRCVAPLSGQDVAELIDDTQAFSLSEHTQLPNFVLPIMLNASHMHRSYPVWYTIHTSMDYLGRTLRRVTGRMYSDGQISLEGKRNIATGFGVFSNCIFKDVGLALAITGSTAATLDHSQMVLRELLVPSVLRADTRLAKRLWRENYGKIADIDEMVRITVLRVLLSSELDPEAAWNLQSEFMTQYAKSEDPAVRDAIARSVGFATDKSHKTDACEWAGDQLNEAAYYTVLLWTIKSGGAREVFEYMTSLAANHRFFNPPRAGTPLGNKFQDVLWALEEMADPTASREFEQYFLDPRFAAYENTVREVAYYMDLLASHDQRFQESVLIQEPLFWFTACSDGTDAFGVSAPVTGSNRLQLTTLKKTTKASVKNTMSSEAQSSFLETGTAMMSGFNHAGSVFDAAAMPMF